MPSMSRRLMLALPLLLAACGDDTPARPPLRIVPFDFSYLPTLPLNVARIEVENQAPGLGPSDIAAMAPTPPAEALAQMARQRLQAGGGTGRAVFVITDASILRMPNGLNGHLRVRLDILTENGNPTAFAEAQVSRMSTGAMPDLRAAAYELTRQMMADMNVEFEYQVRNTLRDWLLAGGPAAPVQTQGLAPITP